MADYISSFSGTEIEAKLNQVKTEEQLTTLAENAFKNSAVQSTTATGNGITAYCYKYGRIAYITILSGTTTAALASGDTLLTLPTAYKPIKAVEMLDTYNSGRPRFRVLEGGTIAPTSALASGSGVRLSACYITAS